MACARAAWGVGDGGGGPASGKKGVGGRGGAALAQQGCGMQGSAGPLPGMTSKANATDSPRQQRNR
jgi:hypothetical protein